MFSPAEISKNYVTVAKTKTTTVWYKLLVLAVLAGAFIAFGGMVSTAASVGYSGAQASLIKGAVFPLGLMLVVVCGAELFTGNSLLVAPLINRDISVKGLLKNWGLVYVGNLVGGVLIAVLVVYSHAIDPAVIAAAANGKAALSFGDALLRGILCNMLVCLAVWATMATKSTVGKIVALYLPVFAFVACGLEHSVADMYYLSAGLMAGGYDAAFPSLTLGNSVLCLLAATIGNIIGGALIAVAYNAVFGKRNKQEAAKPESVENEEAKQEAAATSAVKEKSDE
ncbi:MAG: formate/nitrite transporter family protein [Clostridiales bacterium]|nr:formate/nitrite transporter family protein [Clostridiales bacterium]